ncbi:hypothetical protein [Streptomyces sp. R41]|uniref:Transposase IS4-like domain-containing protein n=1 Tax=Streptomyces sp. R41 TaxID=3238632 RepID=A0AB39RYK3_9ACTN
MVKLYHERWEVESAFFAIKKSMLGRRVLRARTMPGIAQEVYALLATYQLIRTAIADATTTVPGADPDRASFSVALQTARDQVVQAAGAIADTAIDLVGAIGRAVLDKPMPDRRLRVSPRAVKRPLSRYAYKSLGRPAHLQRHHQHRHPVDRADQPITSRPWAFGARREPRAIPGWEAAFLLPPPAWAWCCSPSRRRPSRTSPVGLLRMAVGPCPPEVRMHVGEGTGRSLQQGM